MSTKDTQEAHGSAAFTMNMVGGPQPIGMLAFDNPVVNVNASTQAGPTVPALNLADMANGGIFGGGKGGSTSTADVEVAADD